jgi:hypothetical protein
MRIWRGPNAWRLDRLLSVPQIDLSARADRKMVIFYVYLRYFTKKSRLYRTDMQIKKNLVCEGKTFAHRPMRICVSVYFLKKSQPKASFVKIASNSWQAEIIARSTSY